MRLAGILLVGALGLAFPWAGATRVVRAPYVRVLYDQPALAGYAQQVARAAETELVRVAALFGRDPFPVRVRLQSGDDQFNAFAMPIPRPHVALRALFPLDGALGFHTADPTELVLRHELTHLVQLTDKRVPHGAARLPDIGLVGQGSAVLPPAWLLEGIATWVESTGGLGGRLHDARTRALLWTLAADGSMPTLSDVSLVSFQAWPGGRARYLLGASFIDRLVHEHGFGALVEALHVFQAGAYLVPFADAWKRAVGTDLHEEWRAWSAALARQARGRQGLGLPPGLTPAGKDVGVPALSSDGSRLAWRVAGGVRVARLAGAALAEGRTLHTRVAAEGLAWTGPHTLVLAGVAPLPGSLSSDLFALDVRSGALTRLSSGAHAHLPRADGHGCVLYVRDVIPQGASLRRLCPGGADVLVWRAPPGAHVVGLAVSRAGRIAVSLYRFGRPGGGVDLALLEGGRLRFLTDDPASELDPAWQGEDSLVFASDGSGLFQLYRLALSAGGRAAPAVALTAALGGADQPTGGPAGTVFRTLHGDGYVLARVARGEVAGGGGISPSAGGSAAVAGEVGADAAGARVAGAYPDRPYRPWPSLLPFGWLPTGGRVSLAPAAAGLQLTALGLDDSAHYGLDLSVGYDTGLRGPLAGAYGWLRYAWNMPELVRAPGPPPVLGAAVSLGAWPYGAYLAPVDEVAYGVRAETLLRAPVAGYAGSLALDAALLRAPSLPGWRPRLGLDAVLDRRTADLFGAVTGGEAFAVRARFSYGAAGVSAGAWAEAAAYPAFRGVPVVWQLSGSAGYRPQPPVPVTLPPWAVTVTAGGRVSLPVRLRVGDGLFALERIDVEPAARAWGGLTPGSGARVGAGADLGLWADTVVDYDGLVRLGVRGGYAQGWWLSVGASIPY